MNDLTFCADLYNLSCGQVRSRDPRIYMQDFGRAIHIVAESVQQTSQVACLASCVSVSNPAMPLLVFICTLRKMDKKMSDLKEEYHKLFEKAKEDMGISRHAMIGDSLLLGAVRESICCMLLEVLAVHDFHVVACNFC